MATTTVRLDADDEKTLDQLAGLCGGRARALRIGDLLAEWEQEAGPVGDGVIAAMTDRFDLGS